MSAPPSGRYAYAFSPPSDPVQNTLEWARPVPMDLGLVKSAHPRSQLYRRRIREIPAVNRRPQLAGDVVLESPEVICRGPMRLLDVRRCEETCVGVEQLVLQRTALSERTVERLEQQRPSARVRAHSSEPSPKPAEFAQSRKSSRARGAADVTHGARHDRYYSRGRPERGACPTAWPFNHPVTIGTSFSRKAVAFPRLTQLPIGTIYS